MSNNKHIIFDLDGTIIDSKPEISKTYNIIFNEIRPAITPEIDKLNFALNLNDLLKSVYGDETDKIILAKQRFASIYDVSDFDETILYDGVSDILPNLVLYGFKLYIATNKRYIPTVRILEKKGIRQFFCDIVANEMQPGISLTKREMVARIKLGGLFTDGYMVGDSVSDILAGKDENLKTIAVNYGYEPEEKLAEVQPTKIATSFQNLYTFVINDLI